MAVAIAGLIEVANLQHWIESKPSFSYQILFFLSFTTSLIVVYLYRFRKTDLFVQFYLLSLVVKLLGGLTFCIVIVFMDRSGAQANVVFFLGVYFAFTALEVLFLHRKIS
jgi:hypothetical protein